MIVYPILITTSILVGLAAVLPYRRKDTPDPKVFLAAALANAGALLGVLFLQNRRRK